MQAKIRFQIPYNGFKSYMLFENHFRTQHGNNIKCIQNKKLEKSRTARNEYHCSIETKITQLQKQLVRIWAHTTCEQFFQLNTLS